MSIEEGTITTPCSGDRFASELGHLLEVRAKLSEYLDILPEDEIGRTKTVMALSFVQLAIDALNSFQCAPAPSG
jgi:hypothetical protein